VVPPHPPTSGLMYPYADLHRIRGPRPDRGPMEHETAEETAEPVRYSIVPTCGQLMGRRVPTVKNFVGNYICCARKRTGAAIDGIMSALLRDFAGDAQSAVDASRVQSG
jgi:hypothetical protein